MSLSAKIWSRFLGNSGELSLHLTNLRLPLSFLARGGREGTTGIDNVDTPDPDTHLKPNHVTWTIEAVAAPARAASLKGPAPLCPCLACASVLTQFYGSARSSVLLGFSKEMRGATSGLGLSSPVTRRNELGLPGRRGRHRRG